MQVVHVPPGVERVDQREQRHVPDEGIELERPGERAVPAVVCDAVQAPASQARDDHQRHIQQPVRTQRHGGDRAEVQRPARREAQHPTPDTRREILTRDRRGQPLILNEIGFTQEILELLAWR